MGLPTLTREPLLWFFLIGALLFLLEGVFASGSEETTIEISPEIEQRITDQWRSQLGRAPTAQERKGLLDQWLKEEIYYREALRLNLDDNDTIVRRRLVQKLTFLTEDIATAIEPSDAELTAYFEEHQERYAQPARYSFRHRYFSSDRRNDAGADAQAALDALAAPADAERLGDPFMLQLAFAERSQRQIADLFGREFAAALTRVTGDDWSGPIQSAYGWHLVQLQDRQPARQLPFEAVRERVLADYTLDRRAAANDAYFEQLRSRYRITRP